MHSLARGFRSNQVGARRAAFKVFAGAFFEVLSVTGPSLEAGVNGLFSDAVQPPFLNPRLFYFSRAAWLPLTRAARTYMALNTPTSRFLLAFTRPGSSTRGPSLVASSLCGRRRRRFNHPPAGFSPRTLLAERSEKAGPGGRRIECPRRRQAKADRRARRAEDRACLRVDGARPAAKVLTVT